MTEKTVLMKILGGKKKVVIEVRKRYDEKFNSF
jgi:hypothetical protein